jgi:hypothetical protein
VRIGTIEGDAWGRVLAALGLEVTPAPGAAIPLTDAPSAEVLVAVDGYSLLLAVADRATLLVDVEGPSLYTLAATYGADTGEASALRARLTALAERLCDAVQADQSS